MASIISMYRAQTEKVKAITVFVIVILFALIVFLAASSQMSRIAVKMMRPYSESQELINSYIDTLKKPAQLSDKYFATFKTQQKILSLRKNHYLQLSRLFFRNYYGVLVITMLFSCIGGVVLFIIINRGWGGATWPLRSLFLAILMVVTFTGFFPLVFKQQENFNDNIRYYMNYTKAELNIINQLSRLENPFNFSRTDTIIKEEKKVPVLNPDSTAYLHAVDSMINLNTITINDLTSYVLTIDANEIKSIGDVYKTIANSTTAGGDSAGGRK